VLPRVLILYTGGTFGMEPGLSLPELSAASLRARLQARVPELAQLANCEIEIVLNCDSAHVGPDEWLLLARRVRQSWKGYDGVVILHGTDTLAYSASALSFLLRPCAAISTALIRLRRASVRSAESGRWAPVITTGIRHGRSRNESALAE
jgi:L-asparaginase